jgi:hypothetical protein
LAGPLGGPCRLGLGRRDEGGHAELLAEMVRAHAAHENVDRAVAHHVGELRARGVSWAHIGEALGMTRQWRKMKHYVAVPVDGTR